MGSLSGCIAKAGALLSARDRATLNEAALKMRAAGGDRVKAEKTAVAQVIETLRKAEPKEASKAGVAFDPRRVFDQAAYHGSPYRFNKFTLDHLGKGEGTQVFGHGLYFASLKDVAEFYRGLATAKTGDKGQTYKVEIPEDTVLLDRNAPVAKQPDVVRAALEKLGFPSERFRVTEGKGAGVYDTIGQARAALKASGDASSIRREPSKLTGAEIYTALSKKLGSDKAASDALLDAGVLGLKYLDAHSRAAVSEGRSHNYVIFRGEDVEIRDMFYQGGVTSLDAARAARDAEFERWQSESGNVDDVWRELYKSRWKKGDFGKHEGRRVKVLQTEGGGRVTVEDDAGNVSYAVHIEPYTKLTLASQRQMLYQAHFHGSPHTFDRFSLDHVGTGEGLQAYGWGLYFAEHRGIAEHYFKALAERPEIKRVTLGSLSFGSYNNFDYTRKASQSSIENIRAGIAEDLMVAEQDLIDAGPSGFRDIVLKTLDDRIANYYDPAHDAKLIAAAKDLRRMLERPGALKLELGEAKGGIYKIDIPDEAVGRMLLWDVPLSQQPEFVRSAIPADAWAAAAKAIGISPDEMTGGQFYTRNFHADTGAMPANGPKMEAAWLGGLGIPGLRYWDGSSRTEGEGTRNVVLWDQGVIDQMNATVERTLKQGGGEPLGGYDPASRTMIFTPRANLSTALHESAHHFLELSRAFASAPDAPAQIKDDFDILLRTYGVKGDTPEARLADWNVRDLEAQRAVHERFATEFERYLFEGKAPTQALQPLFSRFRTWMVALYQRLMGSPQGLPDLSPEVRGVMDRMLASEAAIKDAEASRAYAPLPKEAFGDEKAYQDYLDLGMRATERAVDEMTQRSIKDMQWASGAKTKALKQLQAQHNAARKAVSEQVEAEWSESPAVRAEAALRDAHAQGRVEPGVDEAIALASGFRDADDMYAAVSAIRERGGVAAAKDDFVRAETDRRMLIEHGDLVDPKAIDEAANAAVHNGARARFLATGLKVLTKSPVPVAELVRAAKETAAGMIGERKIGDLRVDTYLAAERRANKEVLAKVAKDPAAAIEAQRQAMLANRLAKTALDARAEVDKGLAYLKKMADGPDSISVDARDQITAILERFELGGTRKRADSMRTLAQWIEGQKELGIEPDIPPEIMAEAFRTNYRDLTVDQFRGLVDSIKQVEHLGRLENRLLTARRQETFAQARDAMVEGVVANAAGRVAEVRSSNTVTGRAIEGMRDFWASHITAAMFARRFDGGKDGGVVWEHLIRPANERGHWEVEQRAKATRDLVDIMKPVFALGRMGGNGETFPSIGRKLNRQARLAFALNAGNDGNLQRLLDGNGYTREQIQPVLESLTAAEWKAVQGVWDYMETFRPLIAAKERRVMGREPEWVESTPFTVKTADGQTLRLRGGYYPIKYDSRASARAETHQLAEDVAQQMRGAYTSATTRRSFTKARVDEVHNRPLLESLDGIYSGVQDVIHDLAWHEFLIDANRLMRDESLSQTIRSTWGPEAHQQLRTWLTDVATGEAAARQAGERAVSWVRQGVSIAGLGFNVMNAMLQPLGFTQSISRIGAKWVGRGVAKALGSPMETASQISDMSPFMRTRFLTRFRELNELRNVVQGQSKARTALDAGAYALMLRFQQLVDIPTWWGAYEKAIAEGSDQAKAAALADQAIIDSQGSGMVKDMPGVMRGGQFQKLFTSFYSFFNTTFNLATERTASSQNKAALAAQYLLLFALPATMAAALKDALTPGESDDWSEEKIARKLLGENLGYLLNTMVFVRELGNPVSQSVKGEPFGTDYSGPAGLRMIGDASKVISKITKPNEVEWNDSLRKAVVNLAGDLARLPAAQINRTITGVQALSEGKTTNPAAVLFGYQEQR